MYTKLSVHPTVHVGVMVCKLCITATTRRRWMRARSRLCGPREVGKGTNGW